MIARPLLVAAITLALASCQRQTEPGPPGVDRAAAIAEAPAGAEADATRPLGIAPADAERLRQSLQGQTDLRRPVLVPLTAFEVPGVRFQLIFDPVSLRSELRSDAGMRVRFTRPGVPVKVVDIGHGRHAAFFRGLPRNELFIGEFDTRGRIAPLHPLGPSPGVDYMFRGSIRVGDALLAVLYENQGRRNMVVEFRVHPATGIHRTGRAVALPTLEVPAGTNYEMEPPIFMFERPGGVRVIGGTLDTDVIDMRIGEVRRFETCVRVLEALQTGPAVTVLCDSRAVPGPARPRWPPYVVIRANGKSRELVPLSGWIPWGLEADASGAVRAREACTTDDFRRLFRFDVARGQNSGLLEFGADNVEGRLPWAQIYYLWGFMDLLYLAYRDQRAFDTFGDIAPEIKQRLDLEMYLIDHLLGSALGYRTQGFTVARQPALFAVQTGRMLTLLERYRREVAHPIELKHHAGFRASTLALRGHIEVLADSGESDRWLPRGTKHLRWPRGSAFFYDGAPLPYNHQNEWAYGVFEAARSDRRLAATVPVRAAEDIIRHFMSRILIDGRFPATGEWDYWWGRAYDGWTARDGVSRHRPEYRGDRSKAWISFRTIDVMSVLAAGGFVEGADAPALITSAVELVNRGQVFPFAAYSLTKIGAPPRPPASVLAPYLRVGAPWDIGSAVWALALIEPQRCAGHTS